MTSQLFALLCIFLIPLGGLACYLSVKCIKCVCNSFFINTDYANCLLTFFLGTIAGLFLGFLIPSPFGFVVSLLAQSAIYAVRFKVDYLRGLLLWILTLSYLIMIVALTTLAITLFFL